MKTILVAIDFSPATPAVVAEAAALARLYHCRVALLHVIQPPTFLPEFGGLLETLVPLVQQTEKAAARLLVRWKRHLQQRRLPVVTIQTDGHPATEIIRQARARKAAMIVLGAHGHTAFHDLWVGSTASGVLQKAPCPVVVMPRAAAVSVSGQKAAR